MLATTTTVKRRKTIIKERRKKKERDGELNHLSVFVLSSPWKNVGMLCFVLIGINSVYVLNPLRVWILF